MKKKNYEKSPRFRPPNVEDLLKPLLLHTKTDVLRTIGKLFCRSINEDIFKH